MKKVLLFSVLSLFSVATLWSQSNKDALSPIYTGVPFLGITPDARAGGMGDVGAATTPDVNSQHWNPAKYAMMESPAGLSLSYTPWMSKIVSDISLLYLSGYYKLNEQQALSASLRYFSLGEINLTNVDGSPLGATQPYDLAVDLAYSRLLSEKWSAAVALRYIRSDLGGGMIDTWKAGNSVAADVAAFYSTPISLPADEGALNIGLNISNIGTKITYDEQNNLFVPTNMRLGASFMYPFDKFNTLTFNVDANKLLVPSRPRLSDFTEGLMPGTTEYSEADSEFSSALDDYNNKSVISGIFSSFSDAPGGFSEEMREIAWAFGLEYAYNKQFFVRGGYFTEHETKGNRNFFTAGVGFKLMMFQLDAAYVISVAQTSPLDQTLRFSLSFDMNGLKDLMK